MNKGGFIYILTNRSNTVLYTGVTSDLSQRILQHRAGTFENSFTGRYNVTKLVYYELFETIEEAIAREKQLKAGNRQRKMDLINRSNPGWADLSIGFIRV